MNLKVESYFPYQICAGTFKNLTPHKQGRSTVNLYGTSFSTEDIQSISITVQYEAQTGIQSVQVFSEFSRTIMGQLKKITSTQK